MEKQNNKTAWERLEQVIIKTGHNANSFARHIGLPRGENLYQIKRGNNNISIDVAQRIHNLHPEFSIAWLLCGEEYTPPVEEDAMTIKRIPVLRNIWSESFPSLEIPDVEQLAISSYAANGAQIAVPYTDDILNPFLRDSLLLLRQQSPNEILSGNIYFIVTTRVRMFRIVMEDFRRPTKLRLKTIIPSVFKDTLIPKEQMISIWLVCGAVSQMVR